MTSKIITIFIAIIILGAIGYYIATQGPSGTASSAATATTSQQVSQPQTDARMVGTWKSADDAKFTRTFSADGTVTDAYEGDATATETGTYSVIDPAREANFPAPAASFAGMTVIKVDFPKSGVMYFGINELTDTSLQMTYISGRGNILSFTRVQ